MKRECGSCRDCCINVAVAAFNKPARVPCQHLYQIGEPTPACGACKIYDQRPSECAQYTCAWIDGHLPDEMKPCDSGILLEVARIEWPKHLTLLVGFENQPGALDKFSPQIDAAAVDGKVAVVVPLNAQQGDTVVFGQADDVQAFAEFMAMCEARGGIVHKYADSTVEQKL